MNMNSTSTNAESTGRNSIGAKMAVGITGCSAGILPAVGASSGGRHFRAGRRKPGTRNRRCGRTLFAAAVSLAVAGTLALPPAARAGGGPPTLTWDPLGNHTASDGGGNWDTSTLNWATGSSDVAWVNGDVASIGAGGGSPETVTINTTGITASGLTFNAMGSGGYYTIAGNATDNLTLSNGGNNVDIVMNANATISTPFSVNSNLLVSGNKTLTITGDSTFGSGIGVTIGTGSASNIPTIAALSHGGGGPAFITFNGGTLISQDLGGGGGNVVTSLGGSGIINTFDADANSSSDLQSQINQAGAATFVLRDGTISLTADNSSRFNNGTLQIGNGSLATDVLFGYQVGGANNNNLPASGVTIALDNGSLTQASSNGPNGETVDNAANTINNPVTLSGSNNFIDATGGTIILSGVITNTGTGTLTLEDGTIALTGTNNVLFNTGTLQIGTGSPPWGIVGFSAATNLPGSGAGITLDVGQLDYTGGSAVTVANAISFGGPNGNFIYADNPAVTLTFSGPIIGTGGGFDLSSGTFVLGSTSNSADFTGGGLGIGDGSDPTTVDFGAATNLPGSGAGITLEVGTLAYTGGGQETVFNAITDTAGTNNVIDAGGGASQLTLSGAITNTAGTLTLRNGLFVLGSTSNVTDFTGGTLQIGNGEGGSVAVFTSASNLPASAVGITLNDGTLQYASASLVVTNNLNLAGNGVINVFGFGDPSSGETYNGNITGAGNLTVADSVGGGELYLTGNNSAFTGNTTIQNGVEVGFSTATAFGSGTVSMGTGGGALEYNNSLTVNNNLVLNNNGDIDLHGHTSTWAGVISGPGGLMVHDYFGGDTLTLTAANTYTGGTTVGIGNAVTVTLAPGASLANSNITIHANATLNGSGTLNYHIVNDTADLITDNGTLDITNLNLNLVTSGTQTLNQYVVANYSGGSLTGTKFASVNNLPNGWSVNYGGINPNEIILVAFAPTTLTWDPGLTKTGSDGLGNWDTSAANWATGSADTTWANGDTASIGAGGTGNTITIDVAGISANGITFNALASGQYTIASGGTGDDLTLGGAVTLNNNATISAPLVGSNDVTITGAHTLTLSGDNSGFSGNSTIENGATVNFTTSTALGTGGGITLNDGTLQDNSATGLTFDNAITVEIAGLGLGNVVDPNSHVDTFNGVISGSGDLFIDGPGTVNLDAVNTYSGGTNIIGGAIVTFAHGTTVVSGNIASGPFGTGGIIFGAPADDEIQYAAGGLTIANPLLLLDNGSIDVHGFGGANAETYSGVISGFRNLTVTDSIGGGELILSAANTYTGATTIGDGTHAVTVNLTGSLANSNITINSGATLTGSATGVGTLIYNINGATADKITDDGTLDLADLALDVNVVSAPSGTQYVVADYSGGIRNGQFHSTNLPAGWRLDYGALVTNEIVLVLPQMLSWDGAGTQAVTSGSDGSGDWDTSSTKWSNGTRDVAWTNGDTATIGAGGPTSETITLTAAITAYGLTFNAMGAGAAYTIASGGTGDDLTLGGAVALNNNATISAPIVGNNDISITGAHTLTFSGITGDNSNYSGNITLENGATVNFQHVTTTGFENFGSGSITIGTGGAELQYGARGLTVANSIMLAADGTISNGGYRGAIYSGNITGKASSGVYTLSLTGSGDGMISGAIGDGGNGGHVALDVSGGGTWALTNNGNAYTGGTAVESATTLTVIGAITGDVVVNGTGTLNVESSLTIGSLTDDGSGNGTLNVGLRDPVTLTVTGGGTFAGTVNLTNDATLLFNTTTDMTLSGALTGTAGTTLEADAVNVIVSGDLSGFDGTLLAKAGGDIHVLSTGQFNSDVQLDVTNNQSIYVSYGNLNSNAVNFADNSTVPGGTLYVAGSSASAGLGAITVTDSSASSGTSNTIDAGGAANTLTIAGALTSDNTNVGAGLGNTLVLQDGTFVLASGNNSTSFTGNGTLQIGDGSATTTVRFSDITNLPASGVGVTLDDGTLQYTGITANDVANNIQVAANGGVINAGGQALSLDGQMTNSGGTLTLQNGSISMTNGSNSSTFTGGQLIVGDGSDATTLGFLDAGQLPGASVAITLNRATLQDVREGAETLGNNIVVTSGTTDVIAAENVADTLTLNGSISDSGESAGTLTMQNGTFTLASTGNSTSFTGGTLQIGDGTDATTVQFGAATNLPASTAGIALDGGTLDFTGGSAVTVNNAITVAGVDITSVIANHATSGAAVLTVAGNITGAATTGHAVGLELSGTNTGTQTISGVIGDGSNGGNLELGVFGGTWELAGDNTYSGGTVIANGAQLIATRGDSFGAGRITMGTVDPTTATIQYGAGGLTIANPLTLNGNGIIDANGFGGANAENYSGAISGGGALTIASTIPGGELILSGENSYVGGTNIDTGATAVVDSATALGAGNVNLIGATLENINALYSNNTSGMAINVGGNYAMDSRSTIVLTISGRPDTGQYDTLSVTGTATLAGTLFITFNQGFVPTALDKYTVVTASAVTGQFASVKATNQPVVFSQTVSSTRDVIEILPILNQLTALAGQSMVNIGVQNDVFESESVYGEIADLFAGSGGFNAAGLSLLDTPNADPFTAALNSAMQSVGRQAQNSVSELDVFNSVPSQGGAVPVPGSEAPRNTLSGFATGEVIMANGLPGTTTGGSAHLTTGGVITGVDYNMASHLVLGALFAYGYSGASLDNLGSRLRTNIYSPGLFLGVRKSHFYLDTLASYTYNAYRLNRNITVPSAATADSSPYGNQFAVDSMLGYNFHVARGLKLGPAAGLDYTHLNVSGYTETGGGAGDLAVSPVSFDSLRSLVGGRLNYAWRLRPTASAVNFTANAFWQHEYRNLSRGLIAQFTGLGGSSFASNTPSEGHDSALAGAGVSGNLASNVTLFVNYEAQIGPSHELAQSVMAGVAIALR